MTENMKTPKEKRSWGRILLVVSLSVNLLVLGVAGGALLKFRGDNMERADRPELGVVTMLRALDQDDREALRTQFGTAVRAADETGSHRGLRGSNVLEILRTQPFDAEAFLTVLGQQQSRFEQRTEIGRSVLATHISAMSEAERLAFADRLESGFSRRPHHGHRDR